jgi:hypothetical protein
MLSLLLDGNTSTLLLRTAFNVTLLITRDYRRTISGTKCLVLVSGGLANADRDASDASTPQDGGGALPHSMGT